MRERVDKLLVAQGLAKSRTHAQALVLAGKVCVGDQLILKPSEEYESSTAFRLKAGAEAKFVSRGGDKLDGALRALALNVSGMCALDVGQSTGGFTDCLLQHGAMSVTGVDVGHNQIDWKIKTDKRVTVIEGVNARKLPEDLPGRPFDIAVIDVSFISLALVLPSVLNQIKDGGLLVALIKPQFEVEKGQVGKGGIVKDPLLHEQVKEKIRKFAETSGLGQTRIIESPIQGTDGNKEFFIFGISGSHGAGKLPDVRAPKA